MERLIDEILRGVFSGDLAVALERASAFCRVVSAGRADVSSGTEAAEHAANLLGMADDLAASARLWRAGGLGLSQPPGGRAAELAQRHTCRVLWAGPRPVLGLVMGPATPILDGRRVAVAPGSQIQPLRAASCREALPARRNTRSGQPLNVDGSGGGDSVVPSSTSSA